MGAEGSYLLGLIIFGMDLGVIFFIAKRIVKNESKKNYLKYFLLKFIVLFIALGLTFKLLKPDIILFTLGAFCSLIIASCIIFLLNKNN